MLIENQRNEKGVLAYAYNPRSWEFCGSKRVRNSRTAQVTGERVSKKPKNDN